MIRDFSGSLCYLQAVSVRPRPWSSYTNINIKDLQAAARMNSTDEITRFTDYNSHYCSPAATRRTTNSYDLPEKPQKKEKKWTLSSLFRRRKKNESNSSSEDESLKKNPGLLRKRRKSGDKRKRNKTAGTFDHVVLPPPTKNGYRSQEESLGVLSEPTFSGRTVFTPASDYPVLENRLDRNLLHVSHNSLGSTSVDSSGKRSRKDTIKARAQARRDTSICGSSSDDDSQVSTSSATKLRSNESLNRQRDGSFSRRSRSARTERYLKRVSRDDDNSDQTRVDIERGHNKTNLSNIDMPNGGVSTVSPIHNKFRTINVPSVVTRYASYQGYIDNKEVPTNNHRSLSFDGHINRPPSSSDYTPKVAGQKLYFVNNRYPLESQKHPPPPPPPPPRDPRRIGIAPPNDSNRPFSYCIDAMGQRVANEQHVGKQKSSNGLNPTYRSTSEDHISCHPVQRIHVVPRPSSATPEMNRAQRFGRLHLEKSEDCNNYRYLTDTNPRSRKPICIQQCNGDSSPKLNGMRNLKPSQPNGKFDYWKQKELSNNLQNNSNSPKMFVAQTSVRNSVFVPNINAITEASKGRESSPFRPISPGVGSNKSNSPRPQEADAGVDEVDFITADKRKSTNLEDALDELEAIYNSLHLGDEDLLDRAEQREALAVQKRKDMQLESFPDFSVAADPSYGYGRKRRLVKRSSEPDRREDDMAFRKLNKERSNTIADPQSVTCGLSYLLTSPVFGGPLDETASPKNNKKEPDITRDDVVYRNLKYTNKVLKVSEPQPPFGIPVGPILLAANSDYLHAMPEASHRFTFKPKKEPDVVKDDLAFRNLRKDSNKGPALPQISLSPEDYMNNNKCAETPQPASKRNKAVRSLSANIFSLMQDECKRNIKKSESENGGQSITEVADALEIARQILKEKEDKINATRKAFMSDGEAKYRKYGTSSPSSRETSVAPRQRFLDQMRSEFCKEINELDRLHINKSPSLLDADRLEAKPPTPDRRTPKLAKEPTPVPAPPSPNNNSESTLEELLASLAAEAKETSDRINNELKLLGEERERRKSFKLETSSPNNERSGDGMTIHNNQASKSSHADSEKSPDTEHAELCKKIFDCVVESTELLAASKVVSDPTERVEQIDAVDVPESVANIVITTSEEREPTPAISTVVNSESEHDYENIDSEFHEQTDCNGDDQQMSSDESVTMKLDTNQKDRGNITEDDKMTGTDAEEDKEVCCLTARMGFNKGELCEDSPSPDQECGFRSESHINVSGSKLVDPIQFSSCDIFVDRYERLSDSGDTLTSMNSVESWVSGEGRVRSALSDESFEVDVAGSLESLVSPKLVRGLACHSQDLTDKLSDTNAVHTYPNGHAEATIEKTDTSKGLDNGCESLPSNISLSHEEISDTEVVRETNDTESTTPSVMAGYSFLKEGPEKLNGQIVSDASKSTGMFDFGQFPMDENSGKRSPAIPMVADSVDSYQRPRNEHLVDTRLRDEDHTLGHSVSWHRDPGEIALACSYAFACTHHLASLDFVSMMGVLFAIILLVCALICR